MPKLGNTTKALLNVLSSAKHRHNLVKHKKEQALVSLMYPLGNREDVDLNVSNKIHRFFVLPIGVPVSHEDTENVSVPMSIHSLEVITPIKNLEVVDNINVSVPFSLYEFTVKSPIVNIPDTIENLGIVTSCKINELTVYEAAVPTNPLEEPLVSVNFTVHTLSVGP